MAGHGSTCSGPRARAARAGGPRHSAGCPRGTEAAAVGAEIARDYDVVYLGSNADGHIGRFNLTASPYLALGEDRNNIFTRKPANIRA